LTFRAGGSAVNGGLHARDAVAAEADPGDVDGRARLRLPPGRAGSGGARSGGPSSAVTRAFVWPRDRSRHSSRAARDTRHVPRLLVVLLLLAIGVSGFAAACGGSKADEPRTFTIKPITVQGHTITKVVIPPGAITTR
jgi:hypothetical protein